MNTFTNYLIEANLGLVFFGAVYFLLLHRETQFKVRRAYLLGAMLASVVFPLIEFSTIQSIFPSIGSVFTIIYLPEIAVSSDQSSTINYWNIAVGTYALVAGVLLLLFCIRLARLMFHLRTNAFAKQGEFKIIESNANHPTFSFFHYIFIGNADQLDPLEKDQIINHEKLHANHIHSLDMLVSEVLKIAFWFNPIVYVLKNQLVAIHEFEADQQAVQNQDADSYCDLLARTSLTSAGFSLVNHFNNSLTIKRIVMINTKKTKMKSWKYLMLIPVFAIGFAVVACQDQFKSETSATSNSEAGDTEIYEVVDNAPTFPGGIPALGEYVSSQLHYPDQARREGVQGKVFVVFVVDQQGKVSDARVLKGIGAGCDAEALRIVSNFPNWNPGTDKSKIVKVRYIIPINFWLN